MNDSNTKIRAQKRGLQEEAIKFVTTLAQRAMDMKFEEPKRKGTPKGDPIGPSRKKYHAALLMPLGCSTPRPYPWSWAHNKRRINTVLAGFKRTVVDIDRLILQDITTFPDKLYQANVDFDRIIFEMEERALEDL